MSSSESDSYIDLQNSEMAATKDALDSLSEVETDKEVTAYHDVKQDITLLNIYSLS